MKYKLLVEYDGTRYSGWQVQKDQITVQGKIANAVREIAPNMKFDLQGAGRTDRGVHALGQVAHLDINQSIDCEKLKFKLNDELPKDVNIIYVEKASPNFHARKDAIARSYVYQISKRRLAFAKNYSWWVKDNLSVDRMRDVCELYKGVHDFASFSEKEKDGPSTKLKLDVMNIQETESLILLRFKSRYFLWKMVRRLTGIIVEAGRRKVSLDEAAKFLERPSPKIAELTAPPSGLFLENVYYSGVEEGEGITPPLLTATE